MKVAFKIMSDEFYAENALQNTIHITSNQLNNKNMNTYFLDY